MTKKFVTVIGPSKDVDVKAHRNQYGRHLPRRTKPEGCIEKVALHRTKKEWDAILERARINSGLAFVTAIEG